MKKLFKTKYMKIFWNSEYELTNVSLIKHSKEWPEISIVHINSINNVYVEKTNLVFRTDIKMIEIRFDDEEQAKVALNDFVEWHHRQAN